MTTATLRQSYNPVGTRATTHVPLVPAKRHSSRCPDKNWAPFAGGRNLVEWTLASIPRDLFPRIILSTDRDGYDPATKCDVHRRDPALATVAADVQEVVRAVIEQYGLHDSYIWLLNPTSPFRGRDDFDDIAELIETTGCPAVISVSPVGPFLWQGDRPLFETTGRRINTQDGPQSYAVENGAFYVFRADAFLEQGSWYLRGMRRYEQSDASARVDIDTPDDFRAAQRIARTLRASDEASPSAETMRNETLAVDATIAPPVAPHLILLANHIGRYLDARRCLRITARDRVLDASCGMGYGSYLLAQQAARVVGLDINSGYLATARRLFGAPHLSFDTIDAHFAEPREPFDKLVCIETYEHVPPDGIAAFMNRLLGALVNGGDAYLTFPIGDDGPATDNPFHLNEPGLATIHQQFGERFSDLSYRVAHRRDSFGRCGPYACATLTGYRGDVPC
ncbi:MAG: methyltransferase domain-containing protein [Phycisphaerales bacterium]|nr:methyltransferase domain-containing protein [Phycisphaerales bacterium]